MPEYTVPMLKSKLVANCFPSTIEGIALTFQGTNGLGSEYLRACHSQDEPFKTLNLAEEASSNCSHFLRPICSAHTRWLAPVLLTN